MAILFPEWHDETRQLSYPFSDAASRTNGILEIPKWLFLDGRLYPIGGGERLYLTRVTRAAEIITLGIGSVDAGELATTSYSVIAPPANNELIFTDAYGRPAGMLLAAPQSLAIFGAIGQGTFEFTVDQTPFATTVVVPQSDAGVRGVITDDGDILTGDIWLVGEDGVVIREEGGAARIDIIGDPFATRVLCEDEEPADDPGAGEDEAVLDAYCPLKTINKYSPDRYGRFELSVGSNQSLTNIMRITPGGEGSLRIELLGQRRFQGI